MLNVHTAYHVTQNVELFGLVENVTNARYATFGTFSPVGPSVPIIQAPAATNTRSLSPAPPVSGFAGLRVTF